MFFWAVLSFWESNAFDYIFLFTLLFPFVIYLPITQLLDQKKKKKKHSTSSATSSITHYKRVV